MADNLLQSTFGISKSLLDQVTATTSDVKSGVVYIDSDGVIQTGTLSLSGNAGTGDVKSGKTFYSNSWTRQTGTFTLSGNATTSQVLSGRTYYSNSWTKQTGTMTNRGAVTKSINPGGSYTIPAGYHNGSGKVTANKSSAKIVYAGNIWANGYANGSGYNVNTFGAEGNYCTGEKGTYDARLKAKKAGYYAIRIQRNNSAEEYSYKNVSVGAELCWVGPSTYGNAQVFYLET